MSPADHWCSDGNAGTRAQFSRDSLQLVKREEKGHSVWGERTVRNEHRTRWRRHRHVFIGDTLGHIYTRKDPESCNNQRLNYTVQWTILWFNVLFSGIHVYLCHIVVLYLFLLLLFLLFYFYFSTCSISIFYCIYLFYFSISCASAISAFILLRFLLSLLLHFLLSFFSLSTTQQIIPAFSITLHFLLYFLIVWFSTERERDCNWPSFPLGGQ